MHVTKICKCILLQVNIVNEEDPVPTVEEESMTVLLWTRFARLPVGRVLARPLLSDAKGMVEGRPLVEVENVENVLEVDEVKVEAKHASSLAPSNLCFDCNQHLLTRTMGELAASNIKTTVRHGTYYFEDGLAVFRVR